MNRKTIPFLSVVSAGAGVVILSLNQCTFISLRSVSQGSTLESHLNSLP